jgi:hypothetical protein
MEVSSSVERRRAMTVAIDIRELLPGVIRVSCVSLPGCVGYGASIEEACFEMRAAIHDYFADGRGVRMAQFGAVPMVSWN